MRKPTPIDKKTLTDKGWWFRGKGRFVKIESDLMYAEVYHGLSRTALFVLHRFFQKRSWNKKTGEYLPKEKLTFSYLEARCFGISNSSFKRSIKELVECGFLIIHHQGGGLGNKNDRSIYVLSDEWRFYGTDAFKNPAKRPCASNGVLEQINKAKKEGWVKTFHPDSPSATGTELTKSMAKSDHVGGPDLTTKNTFEGLVGVQI